MGTEAFKLNTLEEVKLFSDKLDGYHKHKLGHTLSYINLPLAFIKLQNCQTGGRLFTALLDLKINFLKLSVDSYLMGANLNGYAGNEAFKNGNILNDQVLFNHKFENQYNASNFIYRYRSIWDKVMGIFILMFVPDDYDKYRRAKSRRKEFEKLSSKIPNFTKDQVTILIDTLTEFDIKFRTPEIHGTGSIRKWSFAKYGESPLLEFSHYWNFLLPTLAAIDRCLLLNQFEG